MMTSRAILHNSMAIGAAVLLFAMSAMADDMPPPQGAVRSSGFLHQTDTGWSSAVQPVTQGGVTYVTGGIGDEERNAIEDIKNDYNLHVTNASKDGSFIGNARILILDHQGNQLVNTAAGPLFYAQLPQGQYVVQASTDGQTKKWRVAIKGRKASSVYFSW